MSKGSAAYRKILSRSTWMPAVERERPLLSIILAYVVFSIVLNL